MLVIQNPPYKIASQVINSTKDVATESVILAPYAKFKKYDLYKFAESCSMANKRSFIDIGMNIQPNLLVVRLKDFVDSRTLVDLEKPLWDIRFADFYEWNLQQPCTFKQFVYGQKLRDHVENNLEKILFIPYWPHVGNAQNEKSVTKHANLGEKDYLERILKSNQSYAYFEFETKEERNNAYQFWIRPLNDELLKGNLTRNTHEKFPRLDWSKSWTESEIIQFCKLQV